MTQPKHHDLMRITNNLEREHQEQGQNIGSLHFQGLWKPPHQSRFGYYNYPPHPIPRTNRFRSYLNSTQSESSEYEQTSINDAELYCPRNTRKRSLSSESRGHTRSSFHSHSPSHSPSHSHSHSPSQSHSENDADLDADLDDDDQEEMDHVAALARNQRKKQAKRNRMDMVSQNSDIKFSVDENGKAKRKRRKAHEISRKHVCPIPGCMKSYGSRSSLNHHIKNKHRDVLTDGFDLEDLISDSNSNPAVLIIQQWQKEQEKFSNEVKLIENMVKNCTSSMVQQQKIFVSKLKEIITRVIQEDKVDATHSKEHNPKIEVAKNQSLLSEIPQSIQETDLKSNSFAQANSRHTLWQGFQGPTSSIPVHPLPSTIPIHNPTTAEQNYKNDHSSNSYPHTHPHASPALHSVSSIVQDTNGVPLQHFQHPHSSQGLHPALHSSMPHFQFHLPYRTYYAQQHSSLHTHEEPYSMFNYTQPQTYGAIPAFSRDQHPNVVFVPTQTPIQHLVPTMAYPSQQFSINPKYTSNFREM